MTGATLFSGIGAPECAAPWIDWRFAAEIERFPSAVLKARFPHVPNLGDVTAAGFFERARAALAGAALDVLVFGSPCQSYSVAGKRLGLDDPRGNLALHALRVVDAIKPRWFVFENVPGLLSSWSSGETIRDETSDFASFLHAVAECGYSACWGSIDAQWFGVAQRRERLFLVGHHRDWRGPAAVLSEFLRVPWDPPSRGESRKTGAVTGTLSARTQGGGGLGTDTDLDGGIVPVLTVSYGEQTGQDSKPGLLIAQTVTAEMYRSGGATAGNNGQLRNVFAVDPNQVTSAANRSNPQPGEPCHTLPATERAPLVAGAMRLRRLLPVETERLQGFPDHWTAINYKRRKIEPDMAAYLMRHGLECWQDDAHWYTRVAADSPRYKAIGNSMAVPVVRYLLERIRDVDGMVEAR